MDTNRNHNTDIVAMDRCVVCQKAALHRCGGCFKVQYCNKQHQRDDWKQHKTICKPFKICENSLLGRHLIAIRTIKPGEIILQEQPLVWGPTPDSIPVCLGCGKRVNSENSRPCYKCGWPVCNDLCEKSPSHLPECRYTVQRGEKVNVKNFDVPHPIYKCITVLRCLYQKQFLPKNWKKLETLEARWEGRSLPKNYENERIAIAGFIRRFFKIFSFFSEDDVMRVWRIVAVNSHEVPLTEPSSVAIYSTSSMMEHNCSANCSKSFSKKGHIIITAAKEIQEGDHLSISYIDSLWGTPNRRYFLHESKFFWCCCHRCEDPTEFGTNFSALKCSKQNCSGHLLPATFTDNSKLQEWVCTTCGHAESSYLVHDLLERIERDLQDLDRTDVDSCKALLATYNPYLPDNHFYCIDVKYTLCQILGQENLENLSDKDLNLKLQYCQGLEDLIKTIAPSEKGVLAAILLEKHSTLKEAVKRNGGMKKESEKILLEAIDLLKNQGQFLPTGKMCKFGRKSLGDIEALLETIDGGHLTNI